jgi:hypothetical protein
LAPGAYRLSASSSQHRADDAVVTHLGVAEQVAGVEIQVEPATYVEGRVIIEPDASPCTVGYVVLYEPTQPAVAAPGGVQPALSQTGRAPLPQLSSRLDQQGRVRFEGVPFGRYAVGVYCQGYRADEVVPTLDVRPEGPATDREWRVSRSPGIVIRAVNQSGELQRRANVVVRSLDTGLKTIPAREPDGRMTARSLGPGAYVVSELTAPASDTDRERARPEAPVTLTKTSGVVEVTLTIADSSALRVSVRRPDHRPYNGLTVTVSSLESSGANWMTDNAEDGVYVLDGLPAGDYQVHVTDGRNAAVSRRASMRSGSTSEVELEYGFSGEISGRVVDEQGSPIDGAWLEAMPDEADSNLPASDPRRGRFANKCLSAADGTFELTGLSESELHALVVETADRHAVKRGVQTGRDVEIVLPKALTIHGLGVDDSGAPVAQFQVFARHLQSGIQRQQSADDDQGRFKILGVPPGEIMLQAIDPRGRIAKAMLQFASEAIEVRLVFSAH